MTNNTTPTTPDKSAPEKGMPEEIFVKQDKVYVGCDYDDHFYIADESSFEPELYARYIRADLAAQGQQDAEKAEALEWIKAEPHETYDGLRKQFASMKSLINSMGQQISYYHKKSYETGEKHLAELRASLESERQMNAQLTEELSSLSAEKNKVGERDPQKTWNEWKSPKHHEDKVVTDCAVKLMNGGFKDAADYLLDAATPSSPREGVEGLKRGIAEVVQEGEGFWRSCSGCHETNEGHDTGPYSNIFKCSLGIGCRECGGIGAVWDNTDYEDMARFIQEQDLASQTSAPAAALKAAIKKERDYFKEEFSEWSDEKINNTDITQSGSGITLAMLEAALGGEVK